MGFGSLKGLKIGLGPPNSDKSLRDSRLLIDQAMERVTVFQEAGCDELIPFMAAPALTQAERMADAVL